MTPDFWLTIREELKKLTHAQPPASGLHLF
jgi:hypothetical protein